MKEIKEDLQAAFKGREYWLELKERYGINEECCLVLCPTDDCFLNRAAMENLNEFLIRKYIKNVVIVSVVSGIKKDYIRCKEVNAEFRQICQEKMHCVLKYYRLTQFSKNIVVISCEEPFGNKNIIGKKGITLSDYVRNAIYV